MFVFVWLSFSSSQLFKKRKSSEDIQTRKKRAKQNSKTTQIVRVLPARALFSPNLLISNVLSFKIHIIHSQKLGKKECLPQLWGVVSQNDQFGFAVSQGFQRLSVAQHVFTGFDDQLESVVDTLHGFFLFIFLKKTIKQIVCDI